MKLNDYFISEDFLVSLSPAMNKKVAIDVLLAYVINNAITYNIFLEPNQDELNIFVGKLTNHFLEYHPRASRGGEDYFVDELIASELLIKYSNHEDVHSKLSALYSSKPFFHCTTTAVTDRVSSLTPYNRFTSHEEIDHIDKIFKRHGAQSPFCYYYSNSLGRVFYSDTANVGYYSDYSPEFFSRFVNFSFDKECDVEAYARKDYYKCKNNVLLAIKEYRLNEKESQEVMDFFEKNWDIYALSQPVIIVKNKDFNEKELSYYEERIKSSLNISDIVYNISFSSGSIDVGTRDEIPFSNEDVLKLPSFIRIRDYLNVNNDLFEEGFAKLHDVKAIIKASAKEASREFALLFEKEKEKHTIINTK